LWESLLLADDCNSARNGALVTAGNMIARPACDRIARLPSLRMRIEVKDIMAKMISFDYRFCRATYR
jgi:hypothetical protein